MAVTVSSSGTQSAVISTEHTLGTTSTAGIYQLMVDGNALANGDVVELRCKAKVLSGGTERILFVQAYSNAQGDPVKMSIPVTVPQTSTWTLKQTAGTGRSFDWALLRLA